MKKSEIFSAALLAVIGLMIFAAPNQFVKVIVILLGVTAIANGILNLVSFSSLIEDNSFKKDILIRGWLSILIGILAIALPLALAKAMWTIMLYVLAVYLLISAILEFYAITRLKSKGLEVKQYFIEAVASVLLAIVLFVFSRQIGVTIVKAIGAVITVISVILLLYYIKSKPLVVEATVVDDIEELSEDNE